MRRIAILTGACCLLFAGACGDDDSGNGSTSSTSHFDGGVAGRPVGAAAGQRPGGPRPGGLHHRDRQSVLAHLARQAVGLHLGGRADRRDPHEPQEDGGGDRRGRAHRHRHPEERRWRLRGGHEGLVRPGRRRQRLVPRRGHQGVRERKGRVDQGVVGARRGRRVCRHHHPGRPQARARVPPGVLQGRGGGRRQGAEPGRHRHGPVRDLRELPEDRGHDAARAGRPRAQVLREERRVRCSAPTPRAAGARSWSASRRSRGR